MMAWWRAAGQSYGLGGVMPQTDEHAALGVAHIARFQRRHAAQLKAKKL